MDAENDRPLLQLALDLLDLNEAVATAEKAASAVDVIEVGTLLCLSEGMEAVRTLRRKFPDKVIVGDVRIVRAGKNIADMTFDAGADWVTVVAEAPLETVIAAQKVAEQYGRELQIELGDEWSAEIARAWREIGIRQVISHSTSEVGDVGGSNWSDRDLKLLAEMAEMGFKVTVTGGITPETLPNFAGVPVSVFIAGRAICKSSDPLGAAQEFQQGIARLHV